MVLSRAQMGPDDLWRAYLPWQRPDELHPDGSSL